MACQNQLPHSGRSAHHGLAAGRSDGEVGASRMSDAEIRRPGESDAAFIRQTKQIVHDLLTKSLRETEAEQRLSAKAALDTFLPLLQQTTGTHVNISGGGVGLMLKPEESLSPGEAASACAPRARAGLLSSTARLSGRSSVWK